MTVDTLDANSPTVFDAGLPAIAYEHAHNPEEAHRLIRQARLQGQIALGPHGVLPMALPQPPNTNQNVPNSSAPNFEASDDVYVPPPSDSS
jgi:hypothetical protein